LDERLKLGARAVHRVRYVSVAAFIAIKNSWLRDRLGRQLLLVEAPLGVRWNKDFAANLLQPRVKLSSNLQNFGSLWLIVVKLLDAICPNLANLI